MNPIKPVIYMFVLMIFLGVVAFGAKTRKPHDHLEIELSERLKPPKYTWQRFCGTDALGRDLFSRILVGCSNTLTVSVFAFLSSLTIGTIVGAVAGRFYKTLIDSIFNWVAAILFSLPLLLIVAALMSLMEKTLFNAYLVMTAVIWVSPARIVRANVIKARFSPFVLTERAKGHSDWSILFRSLIPMSIAPAFTFSFRYFPEIVGMEAGLSFLGLGIQPPEPGLGQMIFDGINYLQSAWWVAFFPALFLFIIVMTANLFYHRFISEKQHYLKKEDCYAEQEPRIDA